MKFETVVPTNIRSGTNIIEYLSLRFTYHSKDHWCECVKNGQVYINEKIADVQDTVNPKTRLIYDAGDFEEPAANLEYRIVFEDEWFLGIDKPGNLLVHRAGRSFKNNLIYQIRFVHNPPFPLSHATHRLDRDTSGVILIAKDVKARAAVSSMFEDQLVDKHYYAVVHGIPDTLHKEIQAPIGKKSGSEISYKYEVTPDGKSASTEIVSVIPVGSDFSLLTVKPLTGRTHQIRIHLAHIGHTIVGDKLYGLSESEYLSWRDNPQKSTVLQFYRHALHCGSIEFPHPYTKKTCRIEAPLPVDMKNLIDSLRTNKKHAGI